MTPFQILIHPWEQKTLPGARSDELGGGGHNHHFVFSQKGGVLVTL